MIFLLVSINLAWLLVMETLCIIGTVNAIRQALKAKKIVWAIVVTIYTFTAVAVFYAMIKLLQETLAVI